jgi:hypothetical protein
MVATFCVVQNNMTSNALYSASYSGSTNQLFGTVKFGVQIEPVDLSVNKLRRSGSLAN